MIDRCRRNGHFRPPDTQGRNRLITQNTTAQDSTWAQLDTGFSSPQVQATRFDREGAVDPQVDSSHRQACWAGRTRGIAGCVLEGLTQALFVSGLQPVLEIPKTRALIEVHPPTMIPVIGPVDRDAQV